MKMKQIAVWIMIACLLLAGCQSTESAQGSPVTDTDGAGQTLQNQVVSTDTHVIRVGQLEMREGGRQRIAYTDATEKVVYITSVDQLPDYEAFKHYDAEFFRENALVLVTCSTSSGSAQVEIESIVADKDGVAKVALKQTLPGDVGTMDMAGWLVWVEVDAGLDLKWELEAQSRPGSSDLQTK